MRASILLLATFLCACASSAQAPISYGQGAERGAQETPAPTAREGRAEDVSGLRAYALRPEDVAPFSPATLPPTHRVGAGEALLDIATRYQIPMLDLIASNGLEPPYALAPGSDVRLPRPLVHRVARGETLASIADRYSVDPRSLALYNRLREPFQIEPGDRLAVPGTMQPNEAAPSLPDRAEREPPIAQERARFRMPLRGAVVARFGAQPGGARLDGIEIAGAEGDRVHTAAAGEVVYAGADVPAYGTLVLIRHAENYVTAYAFNRRALVRVGDDVRAGAPIAELAARPGGGARLLFQVRQGAQAVDPAPLLGLR